MVIIDVFTRRLVGFGVESGSIDGISVCKMFNRAISRQAVPNRISTHHDPLFRFHRWLAKLRVLEIEEMKSIPYTPVSHPFVERLIGTIRREYLDQILFWHTDDPVSKLGSFQYYYNNQRVHRSLNGTSPRQLAGKRLPAPVKFDRYKWAPHCRGRYSLPIAI